MKKILFLLSVALMIAGFSSCKKDSTNSNNGHNTTDTVTVLKHCTIHETTGYDNTGTLMEHDFYFYNGQQLDSIQHYYYNASTTTLSNLDRFIYTYSTSSDRAGALYRNGALNDTSHHQLLDANANVIRDELLIHGSMIKYSTSTFNCN